MNQRYPQSRHTPHGGSEKTDTGLVTEKGTRARKRKRAQGGLAWAFLERVRQSSRERFYNLKMYTQLDKMYTRAQGLAQLSRLRAPWSSLCRCACTLRSRSSHGAEGRFSSRRSLPERMRVVRGRKGGVWPVRPEASTASISSNAVCTMLCSSAHQHAGGSRGGWAIVGSGAD